MSLQTSLPKTIYAIQHLAFEDLGSLEDIFYDFGFRVRYFEAGVDDLTPALNYEGLTVILGGPIGVYETEDYPFLKDELEGLKQRLLENKPTIGICLGAQLIAQALGAKVYAGHQKEIGWSELEIKSLDSDSNVLTSLESIKVLHWHGDTFELPNNATLLASSTIYPNQAFSVGNNILALQFHLEMIEDSFEKWLIGHTCEIRHAGLSIPQLREDNKLYAKKLESKSREVIQTFLEKI
ncbi:glutamine amidotransferase [Acinetobacter beijerinckii]|uniref:glutamine amidotransferase n=1 Tax=Acinetobacter beijerinckii TaxID=262668 RepID=UPI0023DE0429|nr:glutamine amidotransferase [Acinetobacter beijerinckii]MDF2417901.1 glutamine amidotransferase [Acinetobacter beijerinckii]